ncbi:hypothetical protein A3A93_02260 [Candidatus Roizmanbacteria bacterium RIFCSPLOWO2_01_FULL_38_12]|uniref:Nucleotidyl transferase domain-containing protein n=1 Tax=Candidatus Roizmanbacteria bacterium RIFCSPLOWO2_01_FULL_38_12 TaxID=1802061 RepID=A0A1F7IWM5_9BACT|nr:MAG: hypothetical protein A3F59_05175 [Candidatus Roizmanbacteria bacterium RIFCSPHIGHO2_12_FULL_38_13]OGK47756.1 MAG: hypothetical protein A3A93_02260 [Candidatus Roizmanbacteria bacterium RIFCSPLOWO2_01_FULL_38_12]
MNRPLVVILAGGSGKLFSPFVINKTLVPFLGKPLLQHVIEAVEHSGFRDAIVVTNSENETWLSTYQPFNITIQTKIQDKPLGMADALMSIRQEINSRPILVMNAVDYIDPIFLKRIYQKTLSSEAFVTGMKVHHHVPAGYFELQNGRPKAIVEKPEKGREPSEYINLVLHYFSDTTEIMSTIASTSSLNDDHYEKALSKYLQTHTMDLLIYSSYWQKLKYTFNVLDMMELFLKNRLKKHHATTARISPQAVIEGDVYIDEYAHIDAYAVIKGPCYIGKSVKIGNHSLVRQSMIESDSVVGFGSEVARSYVGPRCELHHNFIGDSVLESDVNPSWGTTTANLRLDKKEVRLKLLNGEIIDTGKKKLGAIIAKGAFLGINCLIMPGVTIGKNLNIKPGTTILESITQE